MPSRMRIGWALPLAGAACFAGCGLFPSLDRYGDCVDGRCEQASDAASDVATPRLDAGDATAKEDSDAAVPCDALGAATFFPFLEGSGNIVRDCVGGLTGSVSPGAVWAQDVGRASLVFFDRSDSYVNLGKPSSIVGSGALSASARIRVQTTGDYYQDIMALTSQGAGASRNFYFTLERQTPVRLKFGVQSAPEPPIEASGVFDKLSVWAHVVGVYEPNARIAVYVDGVEVAVTSSNVPASRGSVDGELRIGRNSIEDAGAADDSAFVGLMKDVRFFNRALSKQEAIDLTKP